MEKPALSVVIPVRNGRGHLAHQLMALGRQDFRGPWEVIVSDNGSTDGTPALARSFRDLVPRFRIIDSSARCGAGAARNAGCRVAEAEVVAFCDADDEVAPTWVGAIVEAMETHAHVTGPIDLTTFDSRIDPQWVRHLLTEPFTALGWLPFAIGANFAVRRTVLERVGGFVDYPIPAQDVDASWRIQLAGYPLWFAANARVSKRPRFGARSILEQSVGVGVGLAWLTERYRSIGLPDGGSPGPLWRARTLAAAATAAPWLALPDHRRGALERIGESWGRAVAGPRRLRMMHPAGKAV
jgi:glycosyltransferase involved in cell wall biosynthesis